VSTIDVRTVRGPLEDGRLTWIADLYGRADAKYRALPYLRNRFVENPFGWSLHAFALDGETPVGHCAVVPMKARMGTRAPVTGKVEALFIEEPYRGEVRLADGSERMLAVALLSALYAFADESGIEVLHAYANADLGVLHRLLGCRRLSVGEATYVAVTRPIEFAERTSSLARKAAGVGLFAGQTALRESSYLAARLLARSWNGPLLREGADDDAELGETAPAGDRRWTISGSDSWSWYLGSGLIRILTVPGPAGCRAVVLLPEGGGGALRIVSWSPRRTGLLPALLLLGAAGRLGRRVGAATLRFQPWPSQTGNGTLARACKLLGWIRREDFTTLYVRSRSRALVEGDPIALTPYFYVTF
jgi:hypothetical protein